MKLSPAAFNFFLDGIGQDFDWRRAYQCPNVDIHSGAAEFMCPMCAGKGWFWPDAPVRGKAGMTSQGVQRKFAPMGLYEDGDAILTMPSNSPLYGIGPMDRVLALNARVKFSLVLLRGGPNDVLDRSQAIISRVFWLSADKTERIEGDIPTIGADGALNWTTGGPPVGTQYMVAGSSLLELFCYRDLPSNRMEHAGAQLPRKVHLRVIDLFKR